MLFIKEYTSLDMITQYYDSNKETIPGKKKITKYSLNCKNCCKKYLLKNDFIMLQPSPSQIQARSEYLIHGSSQLVQLPWKRKQDPKRENVIGKLNLQHRKPFCHKAFCRLIVTFSVNLVQKYLLLFCFYDDCFLT